MSNGNSDIGRRTALKSLAAAGGSLALPTVTAQPTATNVSIITGSYQQPLTETERADLRDNLRSNQPPATANGAAFHTTPTTDDDERIVAYVYAIGPNGTPLEHTGTAHSPADVGNTIQTAKAKADQFETQIETTDDVSVLTAESPWNQTLGSSHPYSNDPYGEANMYTRFYHLESGNTDRDVFAARHQVEARPGIVVDDFCGCWGHCCSDYNIDGARSVQDWTYGNALSVGTVSPENEKSGNTTVNCSLSSEYDGADITWDFDLNGPTLKPKHTQIDLTDGIARWKLDVGFNGNASEAHTIEPGSVAVFNEVTDGTDVLEVTTEGIFFNEGSYSNTTVGGTDRITANKINE